MLQSVRIICFCVLLSLQVYAGSGIVANKVVVCYIGTWAVYRTERGSFNLSNVDPSLCTHIVYAFAGLDPATSSIKALDPWQDLKDDNGKGGYERATAMKSKYPHLKVTLAIGGWTEGSTKYSEMAADPSKRKAFVSSVIPFLKKYNFSGLDLDWEYPGMRGGKPEDKQNFVSLVKELKEAMPRDMILTSAIGASKQTIDTGYDVPQLSKYLDLFHIMCYDLHGSWDLKTGANAPLHSISGDTLSLEFTMTYLLSLGAPAEKLVLGIPFYGRTFIKTPPIDPNNHIGVSTKSTGFKGPITKEDGFMGFNEICLILTNKSSEWSQHWDSNSQTPYIVHEDKVVMYDDQKSIVEKVKFSINLNLRGVMIWSIDTDDFQNDCNLGIDGVFDTFLDGLRKIRNMPGYTKALPIVEQKLKDLTNAPVPDILQLTASEAYDISDGSINFKYPTRMIRSYPLLRSLNDALIIANHEQIIKNELEKAIKGMEKDNEIIESNTKSTKNAGSNSLVTKSICYLILSNILLINIIM